MGKGGAEGVEGAATATATGIASVPDTVDILENGLSDFSFSMVPDSDGSSISLMDDNTDDDCDSGSTSGSGSVNVGGGNIISFVVSAIVAYVKTNEVTPMKTYDNIGMWSVFILKL